MKRAIGIGTLVAFGGLALPGSAWARQAVRLGPYHTERFSPAASKDGLHTAYIARVDMILNDTVIGAKQVVVRDGQPGPEFDGIGNGTLVFSPDGRRLGYAGKRGAMWVVAVDGQIGPDFNGITASGPVFSPDGERVAYMAQKGPKWHVVVDGQAGPEFSLIIDGTLVFSLDGRRVGYAGSRGAMWVVAVDGQIGPEFSGTTTRAAVRGPVFSPDGKRVAYVAKRGPSGLSSWTASRVPNTTGSHWVPRCSARMACASPTWRRRA